MAQRTILCVQLQESFPVSIFCGWRRISESLEDGTQDCDAFSRLESTRSISCFWITTHSLHPTFSQNLWLEWRGIHWWARCSLRYFSQLHRIGSVRLVESCIHASRTTGIRVRANSTASISKSRRTLTS